LNEIGAFEDFLRGQPGVGGVLGPHSQLSAIAHLWLARKEGTRKIPEDPEHVGRVIRFFDLVRGPHRRQEVLDDRLDRALVTVFLKDANYRDTRRLIAAIRDHEERFSSQRVHIGLAGDVAVSQAMIPAIVRSQVSSLLIALLSAAVVLCLLFRSLRLGLLALLPVSISVLWVFGAMGWLAVPLGVATSMFCAITLGVGVDYAIHFLESFRRARRRRQPLPVRHALAESGPAIVTDMLAIAGSFGLLVVSQVPSNARLGLLVAIALTAAFFLTLVGLGSVLERWRAPAAG
jgi:predicted RND superfamily exporter protein